MLAFAEKIAAAMGAPRTISLAVKNISDLDAARVSWVDSDLRAELSRAGFQVSAAGAEEIEVNVTLSKNVDGYVWVAEIRSQAGEQVVIEAVNQPRAAQESARTAPVLRKSVVVQRTESLLDFAETAGPEGARSLLLLEPDRVVILQGQGDHRMEHAAAPISHSHPWPRDVRGELIAGESGEFRALLPGVLCTGKSSPALTLSCREGPEARWPLDENGGALWFAADRNYFSSSTLRDGAVSSVAPAWYSMAADPANGDARWIGAGADGNARLFEKGQTGSLVLGRWGDDVVSLPAACGANWEVLTTGSGDWTQADQLQIHEITGQSAPLSGQPLEFPGPILALWPGKNGEPARAISRDLQTGMYEAATVSVTCGN